MKTLTFKLADRFGSMATRQAGAAARREILASLETSDCVEIDFQGQAATPSFADECLGQLAASMGAENFKRRVKLANVTDDVRPLLRHVLARRTLVAA